jgi:glycosyltransferase involved in cell wall biosynthesis
MNKTVIIYFNGYPQSNFKQKLDQGDIIIDDISNFNDFIINNNIKKVFIPYCPFPFYPEKFRKSLFNINYIEKYIFLAGIVTSMHAYNNYNIKKILTIGSWFKNLYDKHGINQCIYPIYFSPSILNIKISEFNPKIIMKKNFCCLGRFSTEKRQEFLLDAFNEFLKKVNYDNYNLYFIGSCDCYIKTNILKKINEYKINKFVHVIEWMDQTKLFDFIKNNIDYNIIVSVCEGLSSVLLETMSLGVPTILSNIPCLNEIVKHKENGILFDYHKYNSLIEKEIYHIPRKLINSISDHDAININNFSDILFEVKDDINLWNKLSINCLDYIKNIYMKNNFVNIKDFFSIE